MKAKIKFFYSLSVSMLINLIPFLFFAISTTLSPGPNNLMLLNAGLYFGVKRSLGLYFGISLGFPFMVLIVALGFGQIFVRYHWIEQGLKILGALYMLYLAYKIAISHSNIKGQKVRKPIGFFHAIAFQWVNPKAWLMAIGATSVFSLNLNPYINSLALSFIFFIVCLPCLYFWLAGGVYLQKFMKSERHRCWFNIIMALLLVG